MRALVAGLVLLTFGCVTVRPPAADREQLAVVESPQGWKAKLGDEPVSRAALFRASGFDPLADQLDDDASTGWGALAAGVGFTALTALFFSPVATSPDHTNTFVAVFRWFTATWALTGYIVAAARLSAAPPPVADALAAAESHNARLEIAKLGVVPAPVKPDQSPSQRRDDDLWQLHFLSGPSPLERAKTGIAGFDAKGRFLRLNLDPQLVAKDVDTLLGAAQVTGDEAWLRATFAFEHGLPEGPARFEAAVVDPDSAVKYARFALDKRSRALQSSALKAAAPWASGNASVLVARGDLENALGDFPAARASYKDALAAAPTDMSALRSYGRALVEAGKNADAVALWVAAIPKVAKDSMRFELLDLVNDADRTWLHAHGESLAPGMLPAYREYQDQKRQERRLAKCLSACAGIQWNSLYDACRADCYAMTAP